MDKHKLVSFYRQYNDYTGGHQKVCDYIFHVLATDNFRPLLYLENHSSIRSELFSAIEGVTYQDHYRPQQADIVFLAGMDWEAYNPHFDESQPKINLIQGARHGDKAHPLFQFLQYKAVRICVSDTVKDAIEPYANGPCLTIKMGHEIPGIRAAKSHDLYILATKQPELGKALHKWAILQGLSVLIHDKPQESAAVHMGMAQSRIAVVLPTKVEGFYLPGIEAMALSNWAVVPDCVASREYSSAKANVTVCGIDFYECSKAIETALENLNRWDASIKRWRGKKISFGYQLMAERKRFAELLNNFQKYW